MSTDKLEPVVPDPKKLRLTAMILVVVMIVGGIVILKAYEKRAREGASDDRPSFLTQVSKTKDLSYIRQDGKVTDLNSLKGKIVIVQSYPESQPDETTTAIMRRLEEKYRGREDIAFVTLVLDPKAPEAITQQLKDVGNTLGAQLPQWTVASNDAPTLHKFIKNEFKANMIPHQKDGKWIYDHSLVLIDRERHVRRAVVPQKKGGASFVTAFDFEMARKWDREGIKTGTDLSNLQQMELLLNQTIEFIINEPKQP